MLMFGDIKFEKTKSQPLSSNFKKDVDIDEVLVSKKTSPGERNYKYFIDYQYNDYKVKPLHIMFPKRNIYVKSYDGQTKWMCFLIEDDDLLEKNYTISEKVSAEIKKEFDSQPVYNKIFLKIKVKFHVDEVTDFYDKGIPDVGSNHTCLTVMSLDSALNKDGNYYPQVFLKECKYIEKKIIRHINDDMSDFSSSDKSGLVQNKLE